jgi:hypothetical protein
VVLEERQELEQRGAAVADQTHFDRIAQADARGVEVDLNAAGLAGTGQELDIGERRPDHQQRVAVFDRLL